jgi:hypothetical protein
MILYCNAPRPNEIYFAFLILVLDPAKPYIDTLDPSLRANKNDGLFVDVIHTNSGNLSQVSVQ